ncbi:uncharacterized protein LOC128252520 [Drosophila gunungcola]|uniref:uncharacterized protein LOC128252520 n=1 Tax=Drosophila gunungcola TaxID=103775 RepID=UPI0022E09F57|nr:uncharacterized protein LOC128252520 [Drosophila gunungcola]
MKELRVWVRDLHGKLDANTKTIEANTNQLAECTQQIAKLTVLLQIFLKGKSKDAEEELVALEVKICSSTKTAYLETITAILSRNNLPKSIKGVLAEHLLCDFNIDGVNGKKALKGFPGFFSVIVAKNRDKWQPHLNQSFYHSKSFEESETNGNLKVLSPDYEVDVVALPNSAPLIFAE